MNFKKVFLTVAISAVALTTVSAQVVQGEEAQTKRGPYETNRFFDNIFIGVAGGVNYYQGEEDCNLDFVDRLAPAAQAYIGKWITPCVGLRVGYYGIQAKGYTTNMDNPYTVTQNGNGYDQKFNLSQVRADLMWNISNAIGGYRADRFWDIAPYIGAGWAQSTAHGSTKHTHNEVVAGVGIYNMFRLCKALDLTLDVNQTYVHQRFDCEATDNTEEFIGSVSLGLAYQFKVRDFSRAHAAVDVTPYNTKIKDLTDALNGANAENSSLKDRITELENQPAKETVVYNTETKVAPVALFFPIGKSTLDDTQLMNLDLVVKSALEADSNHIFTVTGSADSATGTTKINDKLGEARTQKVVDLLVDKYGVSEDNIVKTSLGGTDKYGKPDKLNRCVVVE